MEPATTSFCVGDDQFIVERANVDDVPFIAEAMVYSERAHSGTGIWDVVCGRENTQQVMAIACCDPTAHFYYSKFWVVRDVKTNKAVSGACGFLYPDFSVTKSIPSISAGLKIIAVPAMNDEDCTNAWKRIDFLNESFPEYENWDSWMVEAVYTVPEYRGRGLAFRTVSAVTEEGMQSGAKKGLISCAVGNDGALKMYTSKLGYTSLGKGNSDACMQALGSPGFYLLERVFSTSK